MLLDFDEIIEVLFQSRTFHNITGAFHVGAHICEELSFYNQLGIPDQNVIWIDAIYEKCVENQLKGVPNVYNAVVTDKDDEDVIFNISNNVQSSSVLDLGTHVQEHPDVIYVNKTTNKSITIDSFFERNGLDASKYNFWNFDIQGAELMALKGAIKSIKYAKALYLEVNSKELYKNCGLIEEIDLFLSTFNFKRVLTQMTPHGWGDALYIIDDTKLPLYKHTLTKSGETGRLGNQIIKNLAVSFVAETHDLYVRYHKYDLIRRLGINLFVGKNNYESSVVLNDDNYFDVLNSPSLIDNLSPEGYFQTKDITTLIYDYLNRDIIRKNIMNKNPFKDRYNNNTDLFVHIRLDDAAKWNPGIEYYLKAISNISYDNLYISTDQKNHPIIKTLVELYSTKPQRTKYAPLRFGLNGKVSSFTPTFIQKLKVLDYDEIKTFQFGSTCKNVVLSHGSFSANIGYLSFFSNVYYPQYNLDKMWHGDIFSINGWNKIVF